MAYFWAPQTGNNGNSGTSFLSPKKDFSSFGTFAPGDVVFGLNGEIHDGAALGRVAPAFSSSPSAANPWTLMPYPGHPKIILDGGGTRDIGFRPAVAIDQANGPRDLRVSGLEIRRYTSNGFNIGEVAATGAGYNGSICRDIWIHDITSTSEAGFKSWGSNMILEDVRVEDVGGDGIFLHGADTRVTRPYIRRVSNTGGTLGDAIQFNANSHRAIVEYADIVRENSDKQAVLMCGDDVVLRYSYIRGMSVGAGLVTLFSSGSTSTRGRVYGNVLEGTDGLYLLDATGPHTVEGNIFIGTNPNETDQNSTGVDMNGSQNHQIRHNIALFHQRGFRLQGATGRNNIAAWCGGLGIDTGSGAVLESHNLSFGNGTNFSGTPGAGSIQVDPLFIDPTRPWLGLRADSPCWNAGVWIQGAKDRFGRMFPIPSHIGPWALK